MYRITAYINKLCKTYSLISFGCCSFSPPISTTPFSFTLPVNLARREEEEEEEEEEERKSYTCAYKQCWDSRNVKQEFFINVALNKLLGGGGGT